MDRMDLIQDLILRMEDIALMAGRPRFDRVKFMSDPDELWFFWEADKQAIVVEMGDSSEQAMRIALNQAMAAGGDPVLN